MNIAIILSAGIGERINSSLPKQFLPLGHDKRVYHYSLNTFYKNPNIDLIFFVTNFEYVEHIKAEVKNKYQDKKIIVCSGGPTRYDSLNNAIRVINDTIAYKVFEINIITHDAARPFVSDQLINNHIERLEYFGVVNTIVPTIDSLLEMDINNNILSYPNRSKFYCVQTPQSFKLRSYNKLATNFNNQEINDVIKLFYLNNVVISNVIGESKNFKITTEFDYEVALKIVTQNNYE